MNGAKIFLVGSEQGNLVPMTETSYEKENILQTLLVNYPDLLPGDQITPEIPRQWLLVKAEMAVPGAENEVGRWSLDHLFLDQDGIPTFVECKRAADTRIRREVVAQMLDYAANGLEYWGMDRLRQAAAETARQQNQSLDDLVKSLIEAEEESEVEQFWNKVEANLETGNVRLIFVADSIPKELRRLVEFLNEKMDDVEVLAVEVKQFLGQKQQKVLVPRVIGITEAARIKKPTSSRSRTNQTDFMAKCPPASVSFFEQVLELAAAREHTIYWGQKGFSLRARLSQKNEMMTFAYGWPSGNFQVPFYYLPTSGEETLTLRRELERFDVFEPWGEKSLVIDAEASNTEKALEAYRFWLDKIEEIAGRF